MGKAARQSVSARIRHYRGGVEDARYLAGPHEIATVLGVQANTVNVWQQRELDHAFPEPVVALAGGKIWDIRDVIAWADATRRTVHERTYTAPGWRPTRGT